MTNELPNKQNKPSQYTHVLRTYPPAIPVRIIASTVNEESFALACEDLNT